MLFFSTSPKMVCTIKTSESEFPQGWPQVDPLQPSPFSDRCGPYRTPQTRALLSMAIFSTGVWMMGIFFFRQTLKMLLSYHGWMFEMHGQTSHFTKVWAVSRSQGRGSGIWFETPGASFGVLTWRGEADRALVPGA